MIASLTCSIPRASRGKWRMWSRWASSSDASAGERADLPVRQERALPTAQDEPPPVGEEFEKVFAQLEETNVSERTKRTLRWAAAGYSWAEASEIMGYADPNISSVRRLARRCGFLELLSSSDRKPLRVP